MSERQSIGDTNATDPKEAIAERRTRLFSQFELQSSQGILPLTNELFFEQSNVVVRSTLFSAANGRGHFPEWTEVFSLGSGSIQYRGPLLTVHHETVLAKIMVLARGRSLTQPVSVFVADVVRWLDLKESGPAFKKARAILDDLKAGELRISHKPALKRLYTLLTADQDKRPDGKFFNDYVKNLYGAHLKEMGAALANGDPFEIDLSFIQKQSQSPRTGRLHVNLDPMTAVFFDGINTTLVPFDVWNALDPVGKRIMGYVASHRDGVFPIRLVNYHKLSGSRSEFRLVERRFKSEFNKRLVKYAELEYIEPGWSIYRGNDEEWMVKGLKIGKTARITANDSLVGILSAPDPVDEAADKLSGDSDDSNTTSNADMFQS